MDPITIATAAFAAIKTGVSVGKDLQSLAGDIGKLWGAIDQINDEHNSEKSKRRGSVEEQALQTFIAKKKAEDMEDALRQIIYATRGINGWNELVRLRAQIRRERLEEKHRKQKRAEEIKEIIMAGVLVTVFTSLICFFGWIVWEARKVRG